MGDMLAMSSMKIYPCNEEKMYEKFINASQNNVAQWKIDGVLHIHPSTMINIIKQFKWAERIWMCKRQGRKEAHDLWFITQNGIKNNNSLMTDITTRATDLHYNMELHSQCQLNYTVSHVNLVLRKHRHLWALMHLRWTIMNLRKYTGILEKYMLPWRQHLFQNMCTFFPGRQYKNTMFIRHGWWRRG